MWPPGPLGIPGWQRVADGAGSLLGGPVGGRGSQASNHSVQGGVAPRAHWRPRSRGWGGPTLAGRVAGGRHPRGPGGLSARACPAWSLAEPAAGGTGTKWPSPLGRVSGPEPRGLRFRFQSQPVRQSWVDQAASSNQGAKAPRDSPTPCFCWSQEGTPWGSWDPRDSCRGIASRDTATGPEHLFREQCQDGPPRSPEHRWARGLQEGKGLYLSTGDDVGKWLQVAIGASGSVWG